MVWQNLKHFLSMESDMRTSLFVATLASLFAFGQPAHAQVNLQNVTADLRTPNKETVCLDFGTPSFMYEGAAYWDTPVARMRCANLTSTKKGECKVSIGIWALAPVWYDDVDFQGYSFEFPGMTVTAASVNGATSVSGFGPNRLTFKESRVFVNMADLWMDNDPYQDNVTITVTLNRFAPLATIAVLEDIRKP